MDKSTISFKVASRTEAITFHLRMISVLEDNEYSARFAEIADKKLADKTAGEYSIYTDALAAWSAEMPMRKNGTGKETALGKGSAAEAVREYFKDKTPAKEWLAVTAISAYRNSLFPSVVFLEPSA